ncbi:MAG: histidinol-phosphatase [Bacteroidales bacterium]|jgi:histidinol-phosphatase (PHP family)|nr:histidinol-phosphatase [Bacteroidales bacterium]
MHYKTDYHVHTTFSDGKSAPEEYIAPATEAGLSELGFSEHLSLFDRDQYWVMDPDETGRYLEYIANLRKETENLIIRTGLEIDYVEGKDKEIRDFLDGIELDYRIGAVHYLGEKTVDEGPAFYEGKNFDQLFKTYFSMVNRAVSSEIFDIIAHCDLIRIFGHKPSFDPEPLYRELAGTMKKHDVVFEINTNGRNRPVGEFYPDPQFLKVFAEKKVAVCVNSDAHIPSRVGQYFDEAYQLLRSHGFREMVTFNKRRRTTVKL